MNLLNDTLCDSLVFGGFRGEGSRRRRVGLAMASPGSVEFAAAASRSAVMRLRLPWRAAAPKTVLATSPDPKGACISPAASEWLEPAPF